jgi:hypothetical protein
MLDTTTKPCRTTPRYLLGHPVVSGQYLAKNRLLKKNRAKLAVDILNGKILVTNFTVRQLAELCRITAPTIYAARRPPAAALSKAWDKATKCERAEFVRPRTESVWSALVHAID